MKDSQGTHDFDGSEFENKTMPLHDQFSSQVPLSSSNDVLINKNEAATSPCPDKMVPLSILHWPLNSIKQDTAEEEVIRWRLEKNGFPFTLSDSECGDSSCNASVSEQSSTISSPSTPFAVQSDTQSEDLDRTDIWVSSLDLDAEDSALLPDNEQWCMDIFSADFRSPSFSAVRSLQFGPSVPTPRTPQSKEVRGSDEPLFWPFDRNSYNSPEFDKFLSVSPRRNTMDIGCAEIRQLNPILQRLHKSKLSSNTKSVEPSRGTTNSGAKGTKVTQDKIQKAPAVPSRLSRTTKATSFSKPQPVSNCEKRRPPHLKLGAARKVSSPQLQADQHHQVIGAGSIQKLVDKKSPIEESIGLDEFDGHEGIGSDSSEYQFSLWLSPR